MQPSDKGELKCLVCGGATGRVSPQVCDKCFTAGFGRTKPIPVKEEPAPLYVSDKEKKPKPNKGGR